MKCKGCGVVAELLPWADRKRTLTMHTFKFGQLVGVEGGAQLQEIHAQKPPCRSIQRLISTWQRCYKSCLLRITLGLDVMHRRLQSLQVIDSALRVGRGREDGAGVILQNLDPMPDIGGVILARLGGDP